VKTGKREGFEILLPIFATQNLDRTLEVSLGDYILITGLANEPGDLGDHQFLPNSSGNVIEDGSNIVAVIEERVCKYAIHACSVHGGHDRLQGRQRQDI
jgi:hypothetical protein